MDKQPMDNMQIKRTGEWTCSDIVFGIARLPGTEKLFIGGSDFQVYEFDLAAEKPQREAFVGDGHQSYVSSLALAGETLVSGSFDGQLIWWNPADRSQIRRQQAHSLWIRKVISTPDGKRIVSVADDMRCKVWDAATGEQLADFSDHAALTPHNYPSMLYAVAVSDDGKRLATGDRVGHVAIWDAETFSKIGEVEAPGMYTWDPRQRRHSIGGIRSLAFSPDGTRLAVGGVGKIGNIDHLDGKSRLEVFQWESAAEPLLIENDKKKGLIEQLLWRPDGTSLFGLGGDHKGFVNLYDLEEAKDIVVQGEGNGHIHAAVIDESHTKLYTAAHQRVERYELLPTDA